MIFLAEKPVPVKGSAVVSEEEQPASSVELVVVNVHIARAMEAKARLDIVHEQGVLECAELIPLNCDAQGLLDFRSASGLAGPDKGVALKENIGRLVGRNSGHTRPHGDVSGHVAHEIDALGL